MTPGDLWAWLLPGYLLTVAIELPVLLAGLSARHPWRDRILAGLWLTAVTYPIIIVALPLLLWPRVSYVTYVVVAELGVILVECLLFRWQFSGSRHDLFVVALANVASAAVGLAWFGIG